MVSFYYERLDKLILVCYDISTMDSKDTNMVDKIVRYENGTMDEDETIQFFQELIDSGLAWQLQGSYGRTAKYLIEEGMCSYKTQ